MRRLLAAAVTAALSVALIAAPPAAAAPAVSPNLVANGDFHPALGLADTGWVCEPGAMPEENLPGAEFVQVMPFTPNGKENMVSYLAAQSDKGNYGKLTLFSLARSRTILGPPRSTPASWPPRRSPPR